MWDSATLPLEMTLSLLNFKTYRDLQTNRRCLANKTGWEQIQALIDKVLEEELAYALNVPLPPEGLDELQPPPSPSPPSTAIPSCTPTPPLSDSSSLSLTPSTSSTPSLSQPTMLNLASLKPLINLPATFDGSNLSTFCTFNRQLLQYLADSAFANVDDDCKIHIATLFIHGNYGVDGWIKNLWSTHYDETTDKWKIGWKKDANNVDGFLEILSNCFLDSNAKHLA
ncbi:hypothetical protein CYLTODRAFT_483114, partial [Cylindrobasidium torrendii FP15055 ss-10]